MHKPLYSFVIPCSRPQRLQTLVESIRRQTVGWPRIEIIIAIPRKPTDGSMLPSQELIWVETGMLFPPGAMRNRGGARAQGDFLCFVDDDCTLESDWLERVILVLENQPTTATVGGQVRSLHNGFWDRCADYVLFTACQWRTSRYCLLGSAALVIRTAVFREIGGFNEKLLASEDWEFGLRVQTAGWRSFFCAEATAWHDHGRGSFKAIMTQAYRSGHASGLTVQQSYADDLGTAAKLAAWLAHPWLYPFFAVPYALALFASQAWHLRRKDRLWPTFLPFILLGRLAYQAGVWRCLWRQFRIER